MTKKGAWPFQVVVAIAIIVLVAVVVILTFQGSFSPLAEKLGLLEKQITIDLGELDITKATPEEFRAWEKTPGGKSEILQEFLREARRLRDSGDYEGAMELYEKYIERCRKYKDVCGEEDIEEIRKEIEEMRSSQEYMLIIPLPHRKERIDGLGEFLERHPESKFSEEAREELEDLRRQEEIIKENEDYGEARLIVDLAMEDLLGKRYTSALRNLRDVKKSMALLLKQNKDDEFANRLMVQSYLTELALRSDQEACESTQEITKLIEEGYSKVLSLDEQKPALLVAYLETMLCYYKKISTPEGLVKTKELLDKITEQYPDYLTGEGTIFYRSLTGKEYMIYSTNKDIFDGVVVKEILIWLRQKFSGMRLNCNERENENECHGKNTLPVEFEFGRVNLKLDVTKRLIRKYPHMACWWKLGSGFWWIDTCVSCSLVSNCGDYDSESTCKQDPCEKECKWDGNCK